MRRRSLLREILASGAGRLGEVLLVDDPVEVQEPGLVERTQWYRAHGNEIWEFDAHGYRARRFASINDQPIAEADRKFRWPQGPQPTREPR